MLTVFGETESAGVVFTDTVATTDPMQPPSVFVPVTVYMVVATGETITEFPVKPPGFHVNVSAPDEAKLTVFPEQIVTVFGETATGGVELTDTVAIAELLQPPNVLVPVTV